MINIHKVLKDGNYRSKLVLQVHDELVFDIHKDELETLKPIIESCMKNAIPSLRVPLEVGIGVGQNWLEAHWFFGIKEIKGVEKIKEIKKIKIMKVIF